MGGALAWFPATREHALVSGVRGHVLWHGVDACDLALRDGFPVFFRECLTGHGGAIEDRRTGGAASVSDQPRGAYVACAVSARRTCVGMRIRCGQGFFGWVLSRRRATAVDGAGERARDTSTETVRRGDRMRREENEGESVWVAVKRKL